ncbi:MAG: transglycosylase domain-containing protein, partial [bacterium]|nr:transglycosylase domain-containing protein [bacterium]
MLKKILSFSLNLFVFILKLLGFVILLVVFFAVYFVFGIINQAKKEIVDVKEIRKKIPIQSSEFYSLDKKGVAKVYVENRYWVSITDIPNSVKICLIASEDERFYIHKGVDFLAVLRSILDIIQKKEVTQGASTITQQLA